MVKSATFEDVQVQRDSIKFRRLMIMYPVDIMVPFSSVIS